ncbi:hypothetical protein JQN58_19245 [Aneurinibacillus sp. BA2021]|nr:hypothetical protein [Aneurinibacillus sp. BA2021]
MMKQGKRWMVCSMIVWLLLSWVPAGAAEIDPKHKKEYERLKTDIYQHLMNRETYFQMTIMGPSRHTKGEAYLKQAFEEIAKQDLYLRHSLRSFDAKEWVYSDRITVGFKVEYWTTKKQEDFVDGQVKKIVKAILRPGMNEHEKVKAVHDYIVSHVDYDDSLTEFSAYAALTKGKTVCNGYALLANKMLKAAGIENKIASGYAVNASGKPELHAWNLVRIEGKWYHIDCTWDDLGEGKEVFYPFYALSDSEMKRNHQWAAAMLPKASSSYVKELKGKLQKDPKRRAFYEKVLTGIITDARYRNTGYTFTW